MAKEKSINPAQAHRKSEKAKALKKGKAEQAARRTEKLARRNPERIQRQIDDLKAAESSGHVLNAREKTLLDELQRDVKAVRKARETLGDKAPQFGPGTSASSRGGRADGGGRGAAGAGTLGKRRRDEGGAGRHYRNEDHDESDSSTSSSVRNIPMPRDTPPPIPAEFMHLLDKNQASNPNLIPLPTTTTTTTALDGSRTPHPLPPKPEKPQQLQTQTVYEAKPVVRDLRREAVSAFVPSVVRRKLDASKGQGERLLEPEEVERLEREGYTGGGSGRGDVAKRESDGRDEVRDSVGEDAERLKEEERRFERELKGVEIEDVEDEDI